METGDIVEGYLIDLQCAQSTPRAELARKAQEHITACAMDGHCLESGYGIVDEEGNLTMLDPTTIPRVLKALKESDAERGVKVRATGVQEGELLRAKQVEIVA